MLPSADAQFNYAALPAEKAASARAAAERIRGRLASAIVETGLDLHAQKDALGHGNFLKWIDAEFGLSERTAQKFMSIARELGPNAKDSSHLSFEALAKLAAPSTQPEVREAVLERAANGEKVTAKEIEALKKKLAKAEEDAAESASLASMREARAREAEEQRDNAQTEVLFYKSDKERLANELEDLREEMERLREPGVITLDPVRAFNEAFVSLPTVQDTPWTDSDAQARLIEYAWEKASPAAKMTFLQSVGLEYASISAS